MKNVFKYFCGMSVFLAHVFISSVQANSINSNAIPASKVDNFTYSNYDQVSVNHIYLDLSVNFEHKSLAGFAELSLVWHAKNATHLILDTRDLVIESVTFKNSLGAWQNATFQMGKYDNVLGEKLTIALFNKASKVRVHYQTKPNASGLQWLSAEQTKSEARS